ncbi:MAG: molybdopterin-dependent oxidoreductase [Streptosporangiales bacterium]|nr:molybdopterin-dependent oxidoreductase [Streptosporangiales bacterium]
MSRLDAWAKASGEARYVADMVLPGMLHVALVRSAVQHGRVRRVDSEQARAVEGVVGVFTADDVNRNTYGRSVRDIPILAGEKVRFVGERVAVVVAESRRAAEAAAALVEVEYDDLPAVTSAEEAIAQGAPLVHDAPWEYAGAAISQEDGHNLQSRVTEGSLTEVEAALGGAEHVVDRTYSTSSGHQGYLEPQACVASVEDGRVRLWVTNKSPYRLRTQLADCLGLDPASIEIEPVLLGGDFGGKGSPMDAPLCVELSRLVGRPVKLVLRYVEDLTATNPRHPARIHVRVGCDREGRLTGMALRALLNGGAYGGFKPLADVNLHGIEDCAMAYRVPALFVESTIAYTNTVPRGHMRSPGAPQAIFAVESALDELAAEAGLDPVDLRRRNLPRTGEPSSHGTTWLEARGLETLEAAVKHARTEQPEVPPGWRHGEGVAVYVRGLPGPPVTSVRLVPAPEGRVRVEVPIPETGTGSHTMVRNRLAAELGIDPEQVEVVQVSTEELPIDPGVGGSRVTVGMSEALGRAAEAWRRGGGDEPVAVELRPGDSAASAPVVCYCAQVAQVAVDPVTGQVKVLEVLSSVDVGDIINPAAHQMQIDGGAVMGYGFACLEDLFEEDGQFWAANLGEFKIPSTNDLPRLRTVLVEGGQGVTSANVKPVGELANVPTAAAIANAVAAATGCRIRDLPITSEKVFWAIEEESAR